MPFAELFRPPVPNLTPPPITTELFTDILLQLVEKIGATFVVVLATLNPAKTLLVVTLLHVDIPSDDVPEPVASYLHRLQFVTLPPAARIDRAKADAEDCV